MSKQELDVFGYLEAFYGLLQKPGALLVTEGWDGRANVMAIGWAHVGVLWSEPIMMVYVRPSRHSYTLLEQVRQFTVNTATRDMARAVGLCGTVSGRDEDKFAAAGLTAAAAQKVKPPVIKECILHYECNVLHYHDMVRENMHRKVIDSKYPGGDFHRIFYGEIVACYGEVEELEAGS